MDINCVHCRKVIKIEVLTMSRKEMCPHCYGDLHSCLACFFHDQSAYNECREPMADRITEKDKANFCDYFKLKTNNTTQKDQQQDILSAADALFKK